MTKYHYTECGLENIYLLNGFEITEYEGEQCVAIHDQEGLHRAIGCDLLEKTTLLTGAELRYLRKEMGKSQKELALLVGATDQTVANWEKGKNQQSQSDDLVIRLAYAATIETPKNLDHFLNRLALDEIDRMEREFQEDHDQWEPATATC